MADKTPIYAGLKPDGTFIYAKEFGDGDEIDSKKVSYDTIGNDYLINDNISDNIDVIESTLDGWNSAKQLPSFAVYMSGIQQLWPCGVYTKLNHDTIIRDTTSDWDGINKEYTVPTTGYYLIQSTINVNPTLLTSAAYAWISINLMIDGVMKTAGDSFMMSYNGSNILRHIDKRSVTSIEYLTAGQKINISYFRRETVIDPCATNQLLYTYTTNSTSNFFTIDMIYAS